MITSIDEIAKRGQEIYETKLKGKLEKKSSGKYVAIDVETGEFFIGDTLEDAFQQAKKKYPTHIFHSVKIGSPGVFTVSGLFKRVHHGFDWAL